MLEFTLIAIALIVLIVAGIFLTREYKKNDMIDTKVKLIDETDKEIVFESKYDEITYLYKSGSIDEEEYKNQIKNCIN